MNIEAQNVGKLIRKCVNEIDIDAEIILYGSRARGDRRKDSDWDILVLTDYPASVEKEKMFRDKLYDLELKIGEPISIFIFSKQDWKATQRITPFYKNVTSEGIQL
ncbi:MAG TPA: nucleotidyltransferase domain-containing protein [Hanamia sp.]